MRNISDIKKEKIAKDWIAEAKRVDSGIFDKALDYSVSVVSDNLENFRDYFPSAGGVNGEYQPTDNAGKILGSDWTSSFWTGMIWLAYELTGEEKFKETGLHHSESFRERYEKNDILDHHDIGFLYSLSCVAAYKLTGDEFLKETAILAARKLLKQYMEKCGALQQWGSPTDVNNQKLGGAIIDGCMNLPLLYWASTMTGDKEFFDKAYSHIKTAGTYLVRDNGATHQNIKFDVFSGDIIDIFTSQGDGNNDGCWSRGQAWAIYGFMLSYLYTGDKTLVEFAKICANYFLNRLQSIADITKNYLYTKSESSNALLKAGVYSFKSGLCVNEPTIWGDYFYMEALMRLTHIHRIFW